MRCSSSSVSATSRRHIPHFNEPLVLRHLLSVVVEHQYPIKRRIHEGFEKGRFPEKRIFRLFPLGDVAIDAPVTRKIPVFIEDRHAACLKDYLSSILTGIDVFQSGK